MPTIIQFAPPNWGQKLLHKFEGYLATARNKDCKPLKSGKLFVERRYNGAIALRHWRTDIVTAYPDGRAVIHCWDSKTTRSYLDEYADITVYSSHLARKIGVSAMAKTAFYSSVPYDHGDAIQVSAAGMVEVKDYTRKRTVGAVLKEAQRIFKPYANLMKVEAGLSDGFIPTFAAIDGQVESLYEHVMAHPAPTMGDVFAVLYTAARNTTSTIVPDREGPVCLMSTSVAKAREMFTDRYLREHNGFEDVPVDGATGEFIDGKRFS